MGWIKKKFKGSGQKNSEGHYHGDYAEDPQFYAPSSTGDMWQEHENEEIDRAIALSLLKESQKERNIKNDESQLEEDEQLARAMQESLRFEPPPQYENANTFQPIPIHFPMGYRICAGCNTEIGHGRFLNCLNAFWHPECFRCHACNLPISDYEGKTISAWDKPSVVVFSGQNNKFAWRQYSLHEKCTRLSIFMPPCVYFFKTLVFEY